MRRSNGFPVERAACVVLVCVLITTSAFASHQLDGTWTLDRAQSDDIDEAIEATIGKMNFIARPIARSRLRKTNPAYARMSLSFTAENASISAGPGSPVVLPASGAPIRWKRDDGEVFTVSGKLHHGAYTETFDARDGRRTNVFSMLPDGRLSLQVTVTSPRLPAALRYRLIYRRAASASLMRPRSGPAILSAISA